VGSTAEVLPKPGERGRDQAADHEVRRFHQIPPTWRHIPPPQIILILPEPRTDLSGRSLQMVEAAMTEASEVDTSSRWQAKWTTPASWAATFTSERSSHQVRWMPDPPAALSIPFSHSSSSSFAHIVRSACSSVSQELQSGRTWTASTCYRGSMAGPSRPLKLPPSPPCPQAAVAREASRLRRPSRGPRGRSRRLAGPRKGREAAGVSRPWPQGWHAHRTPCPRTSRMLRRCR